MAVVQGVGYPNPNRSHFRSTEIWQTASDANRVEKYGWIGRYFDHACAGADPTVGIAIGTQAPQSFSARIPKGVSLQDPKGYRFADSEIDESVSNDGSMSGSKAYRAMSQLDFGEVSGASIDSLGGSSQVPDGLSPIDYLERTALDAQISSDLIRKITSKSLIKAEYPANRLASQLKLVSQLIAGGLSSRIYYASHGGFDTHTNQLATHDRLMREVGDSLRTFIDDLKAQGNLDRVMVMMFSEFGRRVSENASQGTDHGAAAPMFLLGSRIKPGIQGAFPSLAPEDLFNGDIRFKIDFRGVYASVLEQWLKTNSAAILGRQFSKLNVVS